jgi:transcriptional regulator with XRE-family HTH domain
MLIHSFGDWLKHRREMNELRQLNTAEFDRIASELRVSPRDLDELVRHGPHAADELPQMLKALGIDVEALARTQPLVLRDMERVCALCHHKDECVREFASGTAAEHYEQYCPNAPTIDVLGPELHK